MMDLQSPSRHPGLPASYKQERFEHPGLDKFAEGSNI
jgi:hypothetical protein